MNRNIFFHTIWLLASVLIMGGCSQDEPADGTAQDLPEGMYPLRIASVSVTAENTAEPWGADASQTRVSESADGNSSQWAWDGTEHIGVQIGSVPSGEYVLNSGNAIDDITACYWPSNANGQTVTAWYPVDAEVSLADQKEKLAYVMKATKTANFNEAITLSFTHQLAKVRVIIEGTADMTGGKIEIKGYTTCTNNKGTVSSSGNQGWISMHPATYSDGKIPCYEANLVPATINKAAFQVTQSGGKQATLNLDAHMTLTAGQLHEVTLTVNKSGTTTVDLSEVSEDTYTVAENAAVILDGKGKTLEKQLVIGAGATVMLKNVVLKPTATGDAVTCNGGNTTLILSGKNEIAGTCTAKRQDGSGILIKSGTLTIKGPGELKVTGKGDYGPGIGATDGAAIVINGGTITASSSNPYDGTWGNPGIGARADKTCGNITINGGHITAQGAPYAAGIGCGPWTACGNILIQGEHTVVTAKKGDPGEDVAKDIGPSNAWTSVGTITFKNGATVNGEKYNN